MCLYISDGGTENATSKPQLKDVMEALYNNVADKWKMIGVLIKIPKGTLQCCFSSTFGYWFSFGYN